MTKRERIAELERKVAALEAKPIVYPYWNVLPNYGCCPRCGSYGTHVCYYTVSSGTVTVPNDIGNVSEITYIGAAS
jgi:hypothetical protein